MTPLLLQEQAQVRQEIATMTVTEAIASGINTQIEITRLSQDNPIYLFGGLKSRLGYRLCELCIMLSERTGLTETEWLVRIQSDAVKRLEQEEHDSVLLFRAESSV